MMTISTLEYLIFGLSQFRQMVALLWLTFLYEIVLIIDFIEVHEFGLGNEKFLLFLLSPGPQKLLACDTVTFLI